MNKNLLFLLQTLFLCASPVISAHEPVEKLTTEQRTKLVAALNYGSFANIYNRHTQEAYLAFLRENEWALDLVKKEVGQEQITVAPSRGMLMVLDRRTFNYTAYSIPALFGSEDLPETCCSAIKYDGYETGRTGLVSSENSDILLAPFGYMAPFFDALSIIYGLQEEVRVLDEEWSSCLKKLQQS